MFHIKIQWLVVLTVCGLLFSCNSSPTFPVPPPEATMITTGIPDANGIVTVVGAPRTAEYGDVVLVFNDDTGDGAMKDAASDGSFAVEIRAELEQILIIQLKRGDVLSPEIEKTVGE